MEQFRANFIVNTGEAFSEDLFVEMRLGCCLMRNAGPTIRCSMIRTDWEKRDKCPENEPTTTLNSFRNIPTKGVVFGMYYQQEFLDRELYSRVVAPNGYDNVMKRNPIEYRKQDKTEYMLVKQGDMLGVRLEQEGEWRRQIQVK